jgi:SAM-dependent methyltransferase
MVNYRSFGNKRIEAAISLLREHVSITSIVVDVGCGIGIASEAAAKRASRGIVLGVDISSENIAYASRTINRPNLSFHTLDIINEGEALNSLLSNRQVDVFLLIDVIEHLPQKKRHDLFAMMRERGADGVAVLLTYPSPYYQQFLAQNEPAELQVIDNVITLEDVIHDAKTSGFEITSYSYKDVWRPAQYVHCVLRRSSHIRQSVERRLTRPYLARLAESVIRRLAHPIRRWKYSRGPWSASRLVGCRAAERGC